MKNQCGQFLVLLAIVFSASAWAGPKKNVCTITINSNDEMLLFKKYLNPSEFNFIELTDYRSDGPAGGDSSNKSFMMNACEKGIRCDVLLVSGHFAGKFFGSSDIDLSLQDLERASCSKACDGILKNPKEVYLFGCNTLAGKDQDHRSPDEYLRVLIEDGFSATDAASMVAFRYSSFGPAFGDRMARVFERTPRIYGFNSVAPSGVTIKPLLERYLQTAGPRYSSIVANSSVAENTELSTALKGTSFLQITGDYGGDPENLRCRMVDPKISRLERIKNLEKALLRGHFLGYFSMIEPLVDEVQEMPWVPGENQAPVTGAERAAFARVLRLNQREILLPLLNTPNRALIGIQLQMAILINRMSWISAAELSAISGKLLLTNLETPFKPDLAERICANSLQMSAFVIDGEAFDIPAGRLTDRHFLEAMSCTRIKSKNLGLGLTEALLQRKYALDSRLEFNLSSIIGHTGANDRSEAVFSRVLSATQRVSSPAQLRVLIRALGFGNRSKGKSDIKAVLKKFAVSSNESIAREAEAAFRRLD